MTNKLNTVIDNLEDDENEECEEDGEYEDAAKKLEHDILKKMDGCAVTGNPDKNDWIKDCGAQAVVYPLVLEVIGLLK